MPNRCLFCGSESVDWEVYARASTFLSRHRAELNGTIHKNVGHLNNASPSKHRFSQPQTLVHHGPNSLLDISAYRDLHEIALLEILRVCRRKVASDPRDKLYGILGILKPEIRKDFRVDYSLSVKDVYTEIVDYLLKTTERQDVICDAIYFAVDTGLAHLPSFVPDWSHQTQICAMGHQYKFSADQGIGANATKQIGDTCYPPRRYQDHRYCGRHTVYLS